jgi:hypothetical protein
MKKAIKVLIITALLWTIFLSSFAIGSTPAFTDTKGHWAEADISQLANEGYLKGYDDHTFRPDKSMTRAEFITVLTACLQSNPTDTKTIRFQDTANHWALAQINEAVTKGILILNEYPTGLDPNGYIKRSEAAAMMIRALKWQPEKGVHTFADQTTVNKSMYRDYIQAVYSQELMSGYPDNSFKPFENVTRAQACALMGNLLKNLGPSTTPTIVPDATNSDQKTLTKLIIDNISYDISAAQVLIKVDNQDIKVTNLTKVSNYLYVNYGKRFALNSKVDNLELILDNKCYRVKELNIQDSSLIIDYTNLKLHSITYENYKYLSEFVNLYIGPNNGFYSLYDAEIIDSDSVKIDNKIYNLASDQLTISIANNFFRLEKIVIDDQTAILKMSKTAPIVITRPSLSDISVIYAGSNSINLDTISSIYFIIDKIRYSLSEVSIDAAGNFTTNNKKIYPPAQITMLLGDINYQLNDVKMINDKFMFFCSKNDTNTWVRINDEYHDSTKIKFLMDNATYNLDQILVVKRNVIRISGKQYNLNSNLRCRFNNQYYTINSIDYDTNLNMVALTLTESTDSEYIQPLEYIFYLDEQKYQEGLNDLIKIKVSGSWVKFNLISINDPIHFSYNNSTYDLLNAQILIDDETFIVYDTSWRGLTQVFNLYVQEP